MEYEEKLKLQNKLIERLADLEHEQWMKWSKYVTENSSIDKETIERWSKNWKPYSELSEQEKEKDRLWARAVYRVIMDVVYEPRDPANKIQEFIESQVDLPQSHLDLINKNWRKLI